MRPAVSAALGLWVLASAPFFAQRAAPRPASPPARRAVPRTETPVPFKTGETLTWGISWSSFITAGTAVSTVLEKKPSFNSTAYYVVLEGRTTPLVSKLYPLYYKMDTLLDVYGLLSQRGSLYAEEGSDHRLSTTRFDRAKRRAFFEQKTETTVATDFAVPPLTQDGLATFYALRGRAFKAGEKWTVPVADSGALFTARIEVAPTNETVTVPLGTMNAWKILATIVDADNQPIWEDIVIWISTDARRLPLKMLAKLPVGAFVVELKDAH